MNTDWSEYYDKFVKKNKGDLNDLYYTSSIEHNENINKIFKILSDDPDAIILDAGCGVGNFIIPLSYKCKFVYGIDISKESIKLCNERIMEKKIKNVVLKVSSVLKIPLESHCIDKILCLSVFHYLDYHQIELVIKEFKRILKKDGILIVNFLNGGSPHGLSTKFLRFIRQIIKGKKNYPSTNIPLKKLTEIIEKENGTTEIIHSAYFYPILFPDTIIRLINNRFYYERFLPEFLKRYGLSITLNVRFQKTVKNYNHT
ncbi:MAG TPA: class I SAM-dependent methyltransferase [Ignavibacteria bacterium]|jgi:ubiquinone/menaquinone biosynthesis C-methylase UbiE